MALLGNSTKHTKSNLYQSFSNSSKREKRREDSQSHYMKPPNTNTKQSGSVSQSVALDSLTPWTVAHQDLCPRDFPGKNTGVGDHFLLQGIYPTQGSNSSPPQCRQILDRMSHRGSQHQTKALPKTNITGQYL